MRNLELLDVPKVSVFSEQEYESRLRKVREHMLREGLDLLLLNRQESIYYLTGYHTFGGGYQALLVPNEGEIRHVLRFLECFLSKLYSRVEPMNILIYDDEEDPLEKTAEVIKDMGFAEAVIGSEGLYMSDEAKQQLRSMLPAASWQYADVVENVRDIKSSDELEYMRESGKISVKAAKVGLEAIKAGVTDNKVAAAVAAELFMAGSEMLPHSPIVTAGWRSGIPHTTFERQKIEEGDTVLIEHSGRYNGYIAPIMRTAIVGSPDAKVREMSDVLMEALAKATEAIKPGVTSGEVDAACRSVIDDSGYYENFRKRTGYSVGLGWPEHLSLRKDDPTMLKPGMTFHLPVALRDYGKSVVGFSVTVAITEDGFEVLTEYPDGLVVI